MVFKIHPEKHMRRDSGFTAVARSHPGQVRGSLRKKMKQQEKREALALAAFAAGLSPSAYRQKQQLELNALIANAARAFIPKPAPAEGRSWRSSWPWQ